LASHLSDVVAELKKISNPWRVPSRFSGFQKIEPTKKIGRKKWSEYPVKPTAYSSPRSHPRQEDFDTEIGKPFFDFLLFVGLRLYRVPTKARFNMQRLLVHGTSFLPQDFSETGFWFDIL